ncbi:MAG TPA: branched-chain amino acid ABC transporter permease [Solirubrobacteraceae bacterium]|nr:branched-chain amino acid ABC transporter permease [Solirubrobacteraceae bacterium]
MAWEYYFVVLLVYLGTDLLAVWGLNLEFGVAGIANLAFIVVVAAGAYTYAVCTLGPDTADGGFQTYVGGFHFPYPLALAAGALVGAVVGTAIGITGLKRLRPDYQAVAMLIVSLMLVTFVSVDNGFLNGATGLALIPNPFGQPSQSERWSYVAMVAVCCLIGLVVLRRFTTGPIGRTLRAMRDDDIAASAIGKDVIRLRLMVQAVGGAFGGLSGALLAGFIGGWSPSAWAYVETLAFLSCVIVGGRGSDRGVSLGTLVIAVLLLQGVQFLPQFNSDPGLSEALGWIVLGGATIVFVWLRPQGVLPERRPRHGIGDPGSEAQR